MKPLPLLALFGGTFNPIHRGHVLAANDLVASLNAQSCRFLPCHRPAHRDEPDVSSADRLAMVALAVAGYPSLSVDDRECRRDAYSYTIDTLEQVRSEVGDDVSLCWIMGVDAFVGLSTWHRWQDLLSVAHLIVMARPGWQMPTTGPEADLLRRHQADDVQLLHQRANGHILLHSTTSYPISATEIRLALKKGERPEQWLAPQVLTYIQQHQLYCS